MGSKRIGPHNLDILSIIFGSLLGDAEAEARAERREKGAGTRITFQQEAIHLHYGIWLYNTLMELGYCSKIVPEISTRLGRGGKIRKLIRFRTWTYTSFNWIHEAFYTINLESKRIKVVPFCLDTYLTP